MWPDMFVTAFVKFTLLNIKYMYFSDFIANQTSNPVSVFLK